MTPSANNNTTPNIALLTIGIIPKAAKLMTPMITTIVIHQSLCFLSSASTSPRTRNSPFFVKSLTFFSGP